MDDVIRDRVLARAWPLPIHRVNLRGKALARAQKYVEGLTYFQPEVLSQLRNPPLRIFQIRVM